MKENAQQILDMMSLGRAPAVSNQDRMQTRQGEG